MLIDRGSASPRIRKSLVCRTGCFIECVDLILYKEFICILVWQLAKREAVIEEAPAPPGSASTLLVLVLDTR